MTDDFVKNCLMVLQKEFAPKKFGTEGLARIKSELLVQYEQGLLNACDHFIRSAFFPSPQQLLDRVKLETDKIKTAEIKEREAEWDAKKERRGAPTGFQRSARASEIAQLSCMAITGLLTGQLPPETFLDFHRHMATKTGDDEWIRTGAAIEADWKRRGITGVTQ